MPEHDHRRDVYGVVDALRWDDFLFGCRGTSHGYLFLGGGSERRARTPAVCGATLSIEHHRTLALFGVSKRRARCII
jgi:hypothetical protein